jgi:hypothetical protein
MALVQRTLGVLVGVALLLVLPPLTSNAAPASPDGTLVFVNGASFSGASDLCANGIVVAPNVAGSPAVITLPAGTYDFKAVPHQASPSCAGPAGPQSISQVVVASGASLSLVTNHLPPSIFLFSNPTGAVSAGHGRVAVYHAVAFGPIDVLVDGQPALAQLGQGEVKSVELPAGAHDLKAVASGADLPDVFDLTAQAVASGQLLQVFVTGGALNGGGPFTVVLNTLPVSIAAPPATAPAAPASPGTPTFTG